MAFDTESGVIVAGVRKDLGTTEIWRFDVCTNMWQRGADVADSVHRLVYHPREDVTVGFSRGAAGAYDVETDTWTSLDPPLPFDDDLVDLDPESGMLIVGSVRGHPDAFEPALYAYDPAADTWTHLPVQGAPAGEDVLSMGLMAYDPAVHGFVMVTDPPVGRTWILDPSGVFTPVDTPTPLPMFSFGDLNTGNEMDYDGATGRTAIFSDGTLIEYDAATEQWVTLYEHELAQCDQEGWCHGSLERVNGAIVYDPINRRIVLFGGSARFEDGWSDPNDVWAFDPVTGEWTVLLEADNT